MPKLLGEPFTGTFRIRALRSGQDHQASYPLHQGPDRRSVARSLEKVALPVARHCPGGDVSRPLGDGRHVGNLTTAVGTARARGWRVFRA